MKMRQRTSRGAWGSLWFNLRAVLAEFFYIFRVQYLWLTDEEKRVARAWFPEVSPQESYCRFASWILPVGVSEDVIAEYYPTVSPCTLLPWPPDNYGTLWWDGREGGVPELSLAEANRAESKDDEKYSRAS